MDLVRKIIIGADVALVFGEIRTGKVVDALVVVTSGPNQRQTGVAGSDFKQLIGGVDSVPKAIHRPPGQGDGCDQSKCNSCKQRSGPPYVERQQPQKAQRKPDQRRSPQNTGDQHQKNTNKTANQVQSIAARGASLDSQAKTSEVSTDSPRRMCVWQWARASSGRSRRGYGSRTPSWQQRRGIPSTRS